jgi:exonuclease SbcC
MGATDRTKMLKEIFELHRFDLSPKTKLLIEENTKRLQTVEGQMKELPLVEAGQIEEREAELEALEASLEHSAKEKAKLDSALKLYEILKNLIAEIEAIHELLDPMEEELPEFEARAAALQRYEEAQGRFQDLIAGRERHSNALALAREDQATSTERLQTLTEEGQALAEEFERARAAYHDRDRLRVEAQDWKTIAELQQNKAAIDELQGRIAKGRLLVEEKAAEEAAQRKAVADLAAAVTAAKEGLPDMQRLHAASHWHVAQRGWQDAVQKAEADAQAAQAALATVKAQVATLLEGPSGDPEQAQAALQVQRTQMQARLTQLQAHVRLTEFAATLVDGTPCPLCGALSHPHPMDPGDVQEERRTAEIAVAEIEKGLAAAAIRLQDLASQRARMEERSTALTRALHAQTHAQTQQQDHAAQFEWEEVWRDAAQLNTAMEAAKAQTAAFEKLQGDLEAARPRLEEAEATRQKYERAIADLEVKRAELNAKQAALSTQIQAIDYAANQGIATQEAQQRSTAANERYHEIGKAHFRAEERQKTHIDAVQKAELALARAATQAETAASSLAQTQAELLKRLEGSSFADEGQVVAMLAQNLDVRAIREEIEAFKTELNEQRSSLRSKQVELGEQQYDADTHQQWQRDHSLLVEAMQAASVEKGRLVEQLARVKADQKRREALEEQATALRDRAGDLAVLAKLFTANGFVNYVSSVYLKDLCIAANARFTHLTRNRLRLEVNAENGFEIRDMVNGGEVRSVKTLSGGQTFQAALSLALALADSIQQRNKSAYNFFFLDEGFGSLDRESLQIVFDTLKNLQKEDRVVGVISHVEELQQEIGTYLSIRQDDERGSQVTPSWRI